MHIHLIRHTQPDIATNICYGQSDIPLATSFEAEKQAILQQLNHHYDAVFSSPLVRCIQLAEAISTPIYQIDKRLLEMDFGIWELKPWHQIHSAQFEEWLADFVYIQAEQGESFIQLYQRVVDFVNDLTTQDYQSIAIVTHAGVIRAIWAWILEIPLQNMFRLQVRYGDICTVQLKLPKTHCTIYQGVI